MLIKKDIILKENIPLIIENADFIYFIEQTFFLQLTKWCTPDR
jgi:hypothetical protein